MSTRDEYLPPDDLKRSARGRRSQTAATADRLPPHSPEAEQGICGCVLLSPSVCLDELHEAGFRAEHCYDLRHVTVMEAVFAMREARQAIDIITLQQHLKDKGLLEQVGGIAFLAGLPDAVPSAANLSYYADIVIEKWRLRTMIQTCNDVVSRVYEYEGDVDTLVDECERDFLKATEREQARPTQTLKELLLNHTVPELESAYHRGRAQIVGYTTGLEYWDKVLGGLGGDNGNYIVLAARPGMGKTTVAVQIAAHVSGKHTEWTEVPEAEARAAGSFHESEDNKFFIPVVGVPVGIFSLEMSAKSLARRILFQRSNADIQRWKTGFAKKEDFPLLMRGVEALAKGKPILIDDDSDGRISRIRAVARRWHRQHGVRFFILDYFQLLVGDLKKNRASQVEEMEGVSKAILALSKELNCPFLILAQMNRDWERDPHRTPQLSDLKGCGAIEQDAHVVSFLYKPKLNEKNQEFYDECMAKEGGKNWKKWNGRPIRVNALVAKNREGETGPAELIFIKASTQFQDWNVWLKEKGYKRAASGEESRYQQDLSDEEENGGE